jgi:hypothetical protein
LDTKKERMPIVRLAAPTDPLFILGERQSRAGAARRRAKQAWCALQAARHELQRLVGLLAPR